MTCISGIFLAMCRYADDLIAQACGQVEALDVVGPRLSKECRERDLSVTDKAAAEIFVFTRSLKVSHTKTFSVFLCIALSGLFQFVHICSIPSIPICCSLSLLFFPGWKWHHEMM